MDNIFPTADQEAQRAAKELNEIKISLREISGKLGQIEKRLKVIAPSIEIKQSVAQKNSIKPSFSEGYLKEKYELLSAQFNEDLSLAMERLTSISKDELAALAKFLGISFGKSPSQSKLIEMVVGRLKESRLLRS